jgi:hypothetical protein
MVKNICEEKELYRVALKNRPLYVPPVHHLRQLAVLEH